MSDSNNKKSKHKNFRLYDDDYNIDRQKKNKDFKRKKQKIKEQYYDLDDEQEEYFNETYRRDR